MDLIKTLLLTTLPIILTAVIGYTSWLYQREKEKRISVQNQLSDKKYQVYIKIINLFFGLFEDTILKKNETQKNIDAKMLEIIIALRKDMGHPSTKINYDDILGMMITDYEKSKKELGLQGRNLKNKSEVV